MDRLEKLGRWPANVIHDGSEEVLAAFPDTAPSKAAAGVVRFGRSGGIMGDVGGVRDGRPEGHDDNGGSAARFFFSPEKDAHCDICRVLLTGGNAKVFSCDAITAKQNSTTRNTLPGAIVPGDAAGSRPLESGDRRQQSSAPANSAGSNSRLCLPANASSVQSDALTLETSRIAQNVRSAASLCASCETAIAQRLAATRLGLDPASLPCPAYMPARRRQILHDQLALYAAGRESTDTITTTASLKTLFGSVFHAIESTTNSERSGSAANTEAAPSRLFYSSKADADDRIGSKHPTVKPINLMRYLVRLVTPPGGVVLDPFAGTGTTGQAAFLEGFCAVLVERETEYQADIARRMELVLAGPDERARAMIKASGKMQDAGPLFAEEGA